MPVPDTVSARQRHNVLVRHRGANDPATIAARRDLKAAHLADELCRIVDEIPHDQVTLDRVAAMLAEAPPITTSQRETAVRLLARRPTDDRNVA